MKKIIIIPDVHGRTFWKDPVYRYRNIEDVNIVFLGDYLDAYESIDYIYKEETIENFKEILDVARNSNNITLLIGNHDLHYWPFFLDFGGVRRYEKYKYDISKIFMDNIDLFNVAYDITINNKLYLFTHAGITNQWWDWITGNKNRGTLGNPFYFKDYCERWKNDEDHLAYKVANGIESFDVLNIEPNAKGLNSLLKYDIGLDVLSMRGRDRGGYDYTGSCLWVDVGEHYWSFTRFMPDKIYQIFGHTFGFPDLDDYVINDEFAMLDSRKAFELDCNTGQINVYKNGDA
jgi:hypothetical protein